MTATTTTRSAYPRAVEDLIPHARTLAKDLGELPSRNKLMKTYRIGSDKAKAVLAQLTTAPTPAAPLLVTDTVGAKTAALPKVFLPTPHGTSSAGYDNPPTYKPARDDAAPPDRGRVSRY